VYLFISLSLYLFISSANQIKKHCLTILFNLFIVSNSSMTGFWPASGMAGVAGHAKATPAKL
jgi:hypothetical protein